MKRRLSRARRGRRWRLALLLPLAALGCDALDPTSRQDGLTPDQFVEVIVAVREMEREVTREADPDSVRVEFERRKAALLEAQGTTEDEIRQFVERHPPALLTEAWERIAQRLGADPTEAASEPDHGTEIW